MNKSTNKIPVSIVISAYNEEKKILDCLKSVKWADEIIVIDNSSLDKTSDISKKNGAKVFLEKNNLMLNVNKNLGFLKAKNEWILSLDADERVSGELAEEIIKTIKNNPKENGFWIARKNMIFGKWIQNSIWWPDYQLRLFRKNKGKFPEIDVHEMLNVEGDTGKLENSIVHYNYESVSQYLYKMDRIYTENAVKNILDSKTELSWHGVIRMPAEDFLKTFFLQKGYRDGLHGLVLSLLQAFYSIIIFAKVWEKKGFPEYNSGSFINEFIKELNKLSHKFQYWILTVLIENARDVTGKLYYKFLRNRANKRIKNI